MLVIVTVLFAGIVFGFVIVIVGAVVAILTFNLVMFIIVVSILFVLFA